MTTSTCPACAANAFVTQGDGGTCSRCGYASGEASRCPHCGVVARASGTGLDAACAMCGGPRIPAGFGGDGATKALREQREALATARLASVATVIQGIVSAMVTLLALAIAPASIVGKVLLFSLAVFPLVLAMRSRVRATKARRRARAAAERAWLAAAEDVAARDARGTTSSALAEALGVDVARADELLTALAVHDRTRIDVDDDAEVRYSVSRAPLVRVGSEPPEPAEEDLERAGAEERQDRREGRAR